LAAAFRERTQSEWCALAEHADVCLSPVLTVSEAPTNAHNSARGTFSRVGDDVLASPAPRFSRTGLEPIAAAQSSDEMEDVLAEFGIRPPSFAEDPSAV
jgi:alpha-methylacyl-CoA racemase